MDNLENAREARKKACRETSAAIAIRWFPFDKDKQEKYIKTSLLIDLNDMLSNELDQKYIGLLPENLQMEYYIESKRIIDNSIMLQEKLSNLVKEAKENV